MEKIIKKFKNIEYNDNNYNVGGGLSDNQFASNRHEDAKYDKGKLTFGKACQLFKKATKLELSEIKGVIKYAVPNMEWHHAGRLPKVYGGGMKKTYFLNSHEIVDIAENFETYKNRYEISEEEKIKSEKESQKRHEIKEKFLKKYATKVVRISERPKYFYEINREMNGKYGWFSSYGKSYNLTEYYTGWKFHSKKKYNEFLNM